MQTFLLISLGLTLCVPGGIWLRGYLKSRQVDNLLADALLDKHSQEEFENEFIESQMEIKDAKDAYADARDVLDAAIRESELPESSSRLPGIAN